MQYDIELEELANRLEREGEPYTAQALRAVAAVRRWDKRYPAQEVMRTLASQARDLAQQLAEREEKAAAPPSSAG